jgi:WD40 repeat protein
MLRLFTAFIKILLLLSPSLFGDSAFAGPPVTALAICPDGQQLLVGSQAGLTLLSLPSLQPLQMLPTRLQQIHDIDFSPDGSQFFAVGGTSGERGWIELHSWSIESEVRSIEIGNDLVYEAEWLEGGNRIVAAGADGICRLVRVGSEAAAASGAAAIEVTEFAGHSQPVLAIRRLDDELLLTAGIDQTLRLWEAGTLKTRRTFNNHTQAVLEIAVRPVRAEERASSRVAATAGEDRTVRLWNPSQGRMLRFVRLSSIPLSLAWTSDGELLMAGCSSGEILTLSAATMQQQRVQQLQGLRIEELLVVPGDQQLIAGCSNGEVRLLPVTPSAEAQRN